MEYRKPFCETVSYADKKEIYDLYFNRCYSYEELEKHFKGKYTYTQLKTIIMERYRKYGQTN